MLSLCYVVSWLINWELIVYTWWPVSSYVQLMLIHLHIFLSPEHVYIIFSVPSFAAS
jgi:hypothetical protein